MLDYKIYHFDIIDSTNTYARQLVKQDEASEGIVIHSDTQTAGKGRYNRNWYSPANSGLWFSIILYPNKPYYLLPLMAGISVCEAIYKVCGIEVKLKWPNDILYQEKKLCGILLEQEQDYIILGIGLNVNQIKFPPELKEHSISLNLIIGKEIFYQPLFQSILDNISYHYEQLQKGHIKQLLDKYKQFSITLGSYVCISLSENAIENYQGWVIDFNNDGALILRLDNGEDRTFYAGEIEHLRFIHNS